MTPSDFNQLALAINKAAALGGTLVYMDAENRVPRVVEHVRPGSGSIKFKSYATAITPPPSMRLTDFRLILPVNPEIINL